jgi:methionyl-tRNA formyltransferase
MTVLSRPLRIVYAGDRDISVWVLEFILSQGVEPSALLLPHPARASHAGDLLRLCHYLEKRFILCGTAFREPKGLEILKELDPDYIICVHFPYIIPKEVLQIPRIGVLNLHPAFLPYNRGWHTPTWAILEGTPYGATLHFMSEEVDAGDIIHQKELEILPHDTADSLYQRVKRLELEVFREAWPSLVTGSPSRLPQDPTRGTFHKQMDLMEIQELNLDETVRVRDLINRLRALTTNRISEAAYFTLAGKRYRVQIRIVPED